MDKDDSNKQIDDDIQQCKADILRAGDIMPPYDKKTELSENKAGQSSQKTTKKEAEEKASLAEGRRNKVGYRNSTWLNKFWRSSGKSVQSEESHPTRKARLQNQGQRRSAI